MWRASARRPLNWYGLPIGSRSRRQDRRHGKHWGVLDTALLRFWTALVSVVLAQRTQLRHVPAVKQDMIRLPVASTPDACGLLRVLSVLLDGICRLRFPHSGTQHDGVQRSDWVRRHAEGP